jgi:hypothetical protein
MIQTVRRVGGCLIAELRAGEDFRELAVMQMLALFSLAR